MGPGRSSAEPVERTPGTEGELQLQRRGSEYEIIYNGVFLMATYNGNSEKEAVREPLSRLVEQGEEKLRVLMGGLGMGYSLQQALSFPELEQVLVAEIEPAVIDWNRRWLVSFNEGALKDPRTRVLNTDFKHLLEKEAERIRKGAFSGYHLIVVDTDNGSSWLSLASNAFFYQEKGLRLMSNCLLPAGAVSFWCAQREALLEAELKKWFPEVLYQAVEEKTGVEGGYYVAFKDGFPPLPKVLPY